MAATRTHDQFACLGERPLLENETVVLTGAAGGIGQALLRALVVAGARVAAADSSEVPLDVVAGSASADSVIAGIFDATDRAAFEGFRQRTESALGPVSGLVNCAGAWASSPYEDLEPDDLARMIESNLLTAFVGCSVLAPGMVERRCGSIVNFASTAGEYGSISPAVHYAASKGGVIALTKSLAREVSPRNVRVNALSPGPTDTLALGADTHEKKVAAAGRTLLGRLGQPSEIATACVFLLSPLASFVTGHVLRVNGGSLL